MHLRLFSGLLFLFLAVIITPSCAQSQAQNGIIGHWDGKLTFGSTTLKIVFHFSTDSTNTLTGTLDSPDQGAFGIKIDSIDTSGNKLTIIMKALAAKFNGDILPSGQIINGLFTQGTSSLPLELRKTENVQTKLNRPQEPQKPYPYIETEVVFENIKDSVKLAGTLSTPATGTKFPAVILISGSGPQDRNEELLGHKPFLVIADYLTRNGIAVLRYDDRGTAKSTGMFRTATSFDFAEDAKAAVEFLKNRPEIDANKIGLIGHSEGGLIAPIVAVESKDVDFIILLASPGLPGDEIILLQSELISRAEGASEKMIELDNRVTERIFSVLKSTTDSATAKTETMKIFGEYKEALPDSERAKPQYADAFFENQFKTFNSPWFRTFISYNPVENLEKVKCPVLALIGGLDMQVPPKENLAKIETSLKKAKNKNFIAKEMPGLNHLFQQAKTGSPSEYVKIENTIAQEALDEILSFIKKQ